MEKRKFTVNIFACADCGINFEEISPRMFSFNSPHGACPECNGLGSKLEIDADLVVPDHELSLNEGAILPWSKSKHRIIIMGRC